MLGLLLLSLALAAAIVAGLLALVLLVLPDALELRAVRWPLALACLVLAASTVSGLARAHTSPVLIAERADGTVEDWCGMALVLRRHPGEPHVIEPCVPLFHDSFEDT